ncbi:protein hinderin isoform X2 [Hyperolius riggenbachi]|uniref:protein hinderin isoform X2 n=1 Tax=Hyperolius riggenbachi TaxID=752182 RepID=UPI0035A38531
MLPGREQRRIGVTIVSFPWLSSEGNLRSSLKFRGLKAEERKPKAIVPDQPTTMDFLPEQTRHTDQQEGQAEAAGGKSASLKDLCPEDKRRIANLIKELARVSEEKEVTEERLKSEHESFEKKIRHLEDQNKLIATEREALQQQYRECQELLSLYQKYLAEQQDKLNRSLSDLGARSVQSHQVPKLQRVPTASELNGSYLGQCHKASNELERSCAATTRPFCRNEPSTACGFHCQPNRCSLEDFQRRKCCSIADVRCAGLAHRCGSALDQPPPHCCMHQAPHSTPRRDPAELLLTKASEDCSSSQHSAISDRSKTLATRVKDSAVSERRKHELMLQKMELEVEKERLQQLLEQQESKLLEKQQELLQTRLESDRNLPAVQTREIAVTTTPSLGAAPLCNGSIYSPIRPSSVGLPTPPSSKNGKKRYSPGGGNSGKKGAISSGHPQSNKSPVPSQSSVCKGSRNDAATSPPIANRRTERNANTSPGHKGILRYETSLIDMLDAISPIAAQRQPQRHYTEPYDLSILSLAPRGYAKPSRQPVPPARPSTMDPEESRMLEEIFFIC